MSELNGPVIVVDDNTKATQSLLATFQSVGWECLSAKNLDNLQNICTDPLNQPIILTSQTIKDQNFDDQFISSLCDDYLVVIALDDQSSGSEAHYFRLGASDILESNSAKHDIASMFIRLSKLASVRGRQRKYAERLQSINSKLQQSIKLLEHDQKAGLEIQKNLMPEGPLRCGDIEIAHSMAPSLYLSGDCVGYQFVLGRYLLFYFVDVSGHGASSAFVTVLLHFIAGRIIRRHAREKQYDALALAPEGLVESINQQLLNTELDKHLTIVAGSLDTETRKLRYVVGAHQPSPILIVDGDAQYLPGKGKPAGIFKDATWAVEEIQLPEKFALVLLSDGVFELLPGKDLIDKETRLLRYLSNRSVSVKSLKKGLFIEGIKDLQDDVSVLLLTGGS
ncbi:MAG: PP2C family protein-serine/threonine phosphatase [Porticoccaceae bacterium]|nr:PP2C family protein-serine/threonine phosphatase [Porticoccaceae bacterium]